MFFKSGLFRTPMVRWKRWMCGIYTTLFARGHPFFRHPHPPRIVSTEIVTLARAALLPNGTDPSRHRNYCPSVVESWHIPNIVRHNNQRYTQNTQQTATKRNQIFILLRSLFHCLNPSPIIATKQHPYLWRGILLPWYCKIVCLHFSCCKLLLLVASLHRHSLDSRP